LHDINKKDLAQQYTKEPHQVHPRARGDALGGQSKERFSLIIFSLLLLSNNNNKK
jgi:hypothetical protein